jgi:hypothetical protein
VTEHSHLPVAYGSMPDMFASELTAVESLGPCVRLVFTVPTQQGTEAYRERVASVVIPHMRKSADSRSYLSVASRS